MYNKHFHKHGHYETGLNNFHRVFLASHLSLLLSIILVDIPLSVGKHLTTSLQESLSSYVLSSSTSPSRTPLLSSASPTPSNHHFRGLPTGLQLCGFHSRHLFAILPSSISLVCTTTSTCSPQSPSGVVSLRGLSDLICSFLSLSILVTPHIVRRTFITAASSFEDVFFVSDQHSAPYVSIYWLQYCGIYVCLNLSGYALFFQQGIHHQEMFLAMRCNNL